MRRSSSYADVYFEYAANNPESSGFEAYSGKKSSFENTLKFDEILVHHFSHLLLSVSKGYEGNGLLMHQGGA